VVEERLGAISILISKFDSIGYPLRRRRGIGGLRGGPRRRCGVGGLRSHAVVSVVRYLCLTRLQSRTFRSEAGAYIDNRREVVIR
jgi:hypothetical protein